MDEAAALDYFWTRNISDEHGRMALLRDMARVTIDRPGDWNPPAIRRQHQAGHATIRLARAKCYGCERSDGLLSLHHVVQIQHGGSNTARNQVPLCEVCHREIHPWLVSERRPGRGLERLGHIVLRSSFLRRLLRRTA